MTGHGPRTRRPTRPSFPLEEALRELEARLPRTPDLFLVLGSGLSDLAHALQDAVSIPFDEIPGFPPPGVAGHAGRLMFGGLEGKTVLIQAGRFHLYEGHPEEVVAAPVRLASRLGSTAMILTNAAGSLDPRLGPGSLLLLEDHINFMNRSPLAGPVQEGEERFPDMSRPYDEDLQALALAVAGDLGILLRKGVYVGVLGPSYETPAEIRFLARAGGTVVGMSTVPETITARALGMRVLALSLVTNLAAGLGATPLSHREVLEVGRRAGGDLMKLIRAVVRRMPE